jgi:hypothetical protein
MSTGKISVLTEESHKHVAESLRERSCSSWVLANPVSK